MCPFLFSPQTGNSASYLPRMVDFIHTTLHGVTVSSSPPSLSLSALPFPFCFVWKILSHEIPRFSLREWNSKFRLMASSWRNKTLRKRWKLFERKIQCILAFYSISYYIYFLLLNTLTQSANHFPNSWYTLILPKATRT